jgi:hypothetical protein
MIERCFSEWISDIEIVSQRMFGSILKQILWAWALKGE